MNIYSTESFTKIGNLGLEETVDLLSSRIRFLSPKQQNDWDSYSIQEKYDMLVDVSLPYGQDKKAYILFGTPVRDKLIKEFIDANIFEDGISTFHLNVFTNLPDSIPVAAHAYPKWIYLYSSRQRHGSNRTKLDVTITTTTVGDWIEYEIEVSSESTHKFDESFLHREYIGRGNNDKRRFYYTHRETVRSVISNPTR